MLSTFVAFAFCLFLVSPGLVRWLGCQSSLPVIILQGLGGALINLAWFGFLELSQVYSELLDSGLVETLDN